MRARSLRIEADSKTKCGGSVKIRNLLGPAAGSVDCRKGQPGPIKKTWRRSKGARDERSKMGEKARRQVRRKLGSSRIKA